jgi:catechol 2,3-dioxygenase-like lactoylglutathione lyase family enzyme
VFDHVTIRAADRDGSRRFYELVLATLGRERTHAGDFDEWNDFGISAASAETPPTRGLHVAFVASSRDQVDAFWHAANEAGYRDDGPPAPRPEYHGEYYGGFVLDPDGNSVEAVYHGRRRKGDNWIDHVWVRVADVAASKHFYETVAPFAGFRLARELPERVHFAAADRSFAVVQGTPTQNLHLAFPAPDDATVDEFHRVAVAAGYRDNGAPGERPEYHAGFYGAYVLDPDGNNVEAVHHNRPAADSAG